jgi:hypothetical protein
MAGLSGRAAEKASTAGNGNDFPAANASILPLTLPSRVDGFGEFVRWR